MFQSVRESMPKPSLEFQTPTVGIEKDQSEVLSEAVKAEDFPNMPALNPKTNFRYQGETSSMNGLSMMTPVAEPN